MKSVKEDVENISLQVGGDIAKYARKFLANSTKASNERHGDERGNQRIFYRSSARFFTEKATNHFNLL